jgi:hypothetical protein
VTKALSPVHALPLTIIAAALILIGLLSCCDRRGLWAADGPPRRVVVPTKVVEYGMARGAALRA